MGLKVWNLNLNCYCAVPVSTYVFSIFSHCCLSWYNMGTSFSSHLVYLAVSWLLLTFRWWQDHLRLFSVPNKYLVKLLYYWSVICILVSLYWQIKKTVMNYVNFFWVFILVRKKPLELVLLTVSHPSNNNKTAVDRYHLLFLRLTQMARNSQQCTKLCSNIIMCIGICTIPMFYFASVMVNCQLVMEWDIQGS